MAKLNKAEIDALTHKAMELVEKKLKAKAVLLNEQYAEECELVAEANFAKNSIVREIEEKSKVVATWSDSDIVLPAYKNLSQYQVRDEIIIQNISGADVESMLEEIVNKLMPDL